MPSSRVHQFGPFRLDADGRVLFRDGERVVLTPKAVDVLIALVEARGQPVGKDELLRKVWAGSIVEEGSLASHVSLLRKALGEGGERGYIETLSKRGYRFIGRSAEAPPPAEEPVMLAVLPFEDHSGLEGRPEFGDGLMEEVVTQLARLESSRLRITAGSGGAPASVRLEGSLRRSGTRVRITARLVRTSDGRHEWAESYERDAHDALAVQADVAKAIAQEVKARLSPSRTLTFLFAGIDGATPAQARAAAMERCDAMLREASGKRGGNALRAVEHASCISFPDAASAVLAAVDVQRSLDAGSRGDAAFRVRMGLHSGTVEEDDDDAPKGPTLARASRVMAAAHGGQILLTASTVALLDRLASPDCDWRDMGDHTLRGFARPERLYQFMAPGLESEFAPIRTQETMRTNLPPALTAFIGRQRALSEVREQVRRSRIVTLVGAGGTGKSRLSLEAARQLADAFPDGVWLVELAPLADATLVGRAIASALGARAEGNAAPMVLIENALRGRCVLLLLDNCEHVIGEAAAIAQALLLMLPQLHLLATSREALDIEGEAVYRVPSLTMPGMHESPTLQDVIASEAGQLFVERAIAAQPAFELTDGNAAAVAKVCRRLDGIPLAIELAAARLSALTVEDIARRIDDRFRLLTGGLRTALPRQRTLRALVDWSYQLLPLDERRVLDKLSVFAGSFSLEGAEQVVADDVSEVPRVFDAIEALVAKSLLIAETQRGAEARYRLLETIRQYASEKLLEAGLAGQVRLRHFACFLDLARLGAKALTGESALEWLDRIETEHDNMRAALDWSRDVDVADFARLAGALRTFWDTRGHYSESWEWLEQASRLHTGRDEVRLEVLIGAGLCAHRLAYAQRSDEILAQAIALAQDLADVRREAEATLWLGWVRRHSRGADAAEEFALQAASLAQQSGDRCVEALALIERGKSARGRGQYTEAQGLFLDGARLIADAGCVIHAPSATDEAGECALAQLDFDAARNLLGDSLVQHRRIGNAHDAANTQVLLALVALNEHRLDEALALCSDSLRVFHALHDPKCSARTAIAHATVLRARGDAQEALLHAEAAASTYRELDIPLQLARALCTAGCIHAALGHEKAAQRALFSGLVEQQRADCDTHLPELLEAIAALHPDAPVAVQLLGAAAARREQLNTPIPPHDSAERERWNTDMRARHSLSEFEHAFAAGRAMTRDEAIQNALAMQRKPGR